jgi:hypothetical protein
MPGTTGKKTFDTSFNFGANVKRSHARRLKGGGTKGGKGNAWRNYVKGKKK